MYTVYLSQFNKWIKETHTALNENQTSKTEAFYAVMCSIPYKGPSNQGFQF